MGREGKIFTGGHGACDFNITYYKQRKRKRDKAKNDESCQLQPPPQLWKLATQKTLLRHSPHCPGVLKLKARQLIAHPGFRNQVRSFRSLLGSSSHVLLVFRTFLALWVFDIVAGSVRWESQLSGP